GQPLALPQAQPKGSRGGGVLEADELQDVRDPSGSLLGLQPETLHAELHLVLDAQLEELPIRVLADEAGKSTQGARVGAARIDALDQDPTSRRAEQSVHMLPEGRLPRSVLAHDGEHLSRLDGQPRMSKRDGASFAE